VRVLDLFCGAGGAAAGLRRAWPDAEIVGVDIVHQKRYPFAFVQADATTYLLDGFDFVWASPPCERYSRATAQQRNKGVVYADLVAVTRARLVASGLPYVIENVPLAPMRHDAITLCGQMLGLRLLRHRLFECSFAVDVPAHRSHGGLVRGPQGDFVCVVPNAWKAAIHHDNTLPVWQAAMEIDWMTKSELSQAVPPAYSEYIARQAGRGL
jgi:DNA (cytosine-5)-methyltransferase 1